MKYVIWAHAWEMVILKGAHRRVFQHFHTSDIESNVSWILGEDVAKYEIKLSEDNSTTPSWAFILNFEWEVRNAVARSMKRQGLTLVQALEHVRSDESLYNRKWAHPLGNPINWASSLYPRHSSGSVRSSAPPKSDVEAKLDRLSRDVGKLATQVNKRGSNVNGGGSAVGQGKVGRRGDQRRNRSPPADDATGPDGKKLLKFFLKTAHGRRLLKLDKPRDDNKRICYGFQKGNCPETYKCKFLHECAVCGNKQKGMDQCDCPRTHLEYALKKLKK